MIIKKVIDQTEHYELCLLQYHDNELKEEVHTYTVRNKEHDVHEWQGGVLFMAQQALQDLERNAYGPRHAMVDPDSNSGQHNGLLIN